MSVDRSIVINQDIKSAANVKHSLKVKFVVYYVMTKMGAIE